MRIIHHIGASASGQEVATLKKMGIVVPEFGKTAITDVFYFDLDEESEHYRKLQPCIREFKLLDMVVTEFTEEEKNNAEILVIQAQWLNGYPQLEDNYRQTVYEIPADSSINGYMGISQKDFFRLKKEPNWGNKKIFHLNWVADELFVRKDIYNEIFKKYGLESKPVLLYKTGSVIENTVQLIIPTTTESLILDNFNYEIMPNGSKRFAPYFRGFFPNFGNPVSLSIWKSKEWFGSGSRSFKRIFIKRELREEFLKHKLKIDYTPCFD